MIKLVIFDLAGTTVRDNGAVVSAFSSALRKHGIEVDDARINAVRGSSKRQAILELLPESPNRKELAETAYASFVEILAATYNGNGVSSIDGAAQVFKKLRAEGVLVALNTGFDRQITDLLLDRLGWTGDNIDAVVCGDEVHRGRPWPELIHAAMHRTGISNPNEVANVGDTILDLRAGHNAGVKWNIGVLTGAHDRTQLEKEPHTHILPSVNDVPSLWGS
ncbi:MAG TPA: phosphonatase-like hydrolase [Pyrinomonadaceae bacterium]|nr:phosphonatase-like hydrolase [Pyrinomonadaceae bacterium]